MKRKRLGLCGAAAVFAVTLSINEVHAISRYNPTTMTCSQVKATVRAEGAVILRWPSSQDPTRPLFGRYVASRNYCEIWQIMQTHYVPTADRKRCGVSKCKNDNRDKDDLFKFWLRR